MALKSLTEALGLLGKKPLVWIPGLFAAFAVLLTYYVFMLFGATAGFATGAAMLILLPAFLAGTYGLIIGGAFAAADFRKYAAYGYFRCLITNVLVLLIGFVLSNTLTYILLMVGISLDIAMYFSIFLIVPLVFFFYFADISAIVHNLSPFRALKDSAFRVAMGSIQITAFYLFNIALIFAAFFIFSGVWSVLASDALMPLAGMTEAEILALSQAELLALFTAPEILSSGAISLAACCLLFLPVFVSYKACFYKRSLLDLSSHAPREEEEGAFDEKGRWYKYS
ncbi:hypothetical protein SDC9_50893 [bioreactor metagenome]|uniref:Uncharacterized protein n=1 Tax=bioreactor metagenome TaxID=1076179 RepID=A0A644WL59_9ZZZZ|nr:hypothetical protein [Methanocorpusculum sp.]